MTRVIRIEPIAAALWRVTVEAAGEPPVDIVQARTMGEAWEKAPACPDEP